ncbi:uncharacterized protein LOC142362793 isoform X2 [Opisthocomus hoazin]|uniref:uncharacterized protein LOC142362793 isoform X2 n=1 Tax=Opisthocomus hoazin TaxID=30419 RepID=UPI003F535D21
MAGQSRAGWLSLGLARDVSGALPSRRDPAFQASELRGHSVRRGAASRRLPPTGMVGLLRICNAPRLTSALSQRPVPDLRKSCKVSAGLAVPVERDLELPAQSRQRSASALKKSPEYLEMQDSTLLCLASVVPHLRRWKDSLQGPPGGFPGPFSAVLAFCILMELDAQEQRIYQLQTKQRERQAELEQKCSRIQQLSQDLKASHQLQEEAQKQYSPKPSAPEEGTELQPLGRQVKSPKNESANAPELWQGSDHLAVPRTFKIGDSCETSEKQETMSLDEPHNAAALSSPKHGCPQVPALPERLHNPAGRAQAPALR